jgi:penicillin-binding protein-related factor A (putative recombinase)
MFLFSTMMLLFSCTQEDSVIQQCIEGDVPIIEIKTLRHLQNVSDQDTTVYLVIQTQEEYEKYLLETFVPVDFKKYTMLAGRHIAMASDFVTKQTVTQDCATNKISYHVELGHGNHASIERVPYVVLIPKISSDRIVDFSLVYN